MSIDLTKELFGELGDGNGSFKKGDHIAEGPEDVLEGKSDIRGERGLDGERVDHFLSPRQRVLLLAYFNGLTVPDLVKLYGVSQGSMSALIRSDKAQDFLTGLYERQTNEAVRKHDEVQEFLSRHQLEAAQIHVDLMRYSENDRLRFVSADSILTKGGHGARQPTESQAEIPQLIINFNKVDVHNNNGGGNGSSFPSVPAKISQERETLPGPIPPPFEKAEDSQ